MRLTLILALELTHPSQSADTAEMRETETDAAIERLEELLRDARPIPLTDQVRIDLRRAQLLVSEVRDNLSAERRSRSEA